MSHIPTILVFDSGIGGLSVYNEVRQKIKNAHYIYFFDNEGFPYGDKSNQYLVQRVINAISSITMLYKIDLVVIACNTASTICLPGLRSQFNMPIVGVVPAIKPATLITKNNCIGLLATKATIQREYTHQLITQFASNYRVELLGLSELALIAEQKLQNIPVDKKKLKELMTPWLTLPIVPDTIVLGCTHYPFIRDELQEIFPQAQFIDSGYAIANRVETLLVDQIPKLETSIEQNKDRNIICSTHYDPSVKNLVAKLDKYEFSNYQLVSI